jgi:hypothetical protein
VSEAVSFIAAIRSGDLATVEAVGEVAALFQSTI